MRTLMIVAALLLMASCAGKSGQSRRITAVAAVAHALDEADDHLQVRYNPPQCGCAPFEVKTAEGWVRAAFSEADEEEDLDALLAQAQADAAQGELPEYRVHASLITGTPSYCQNRVPYASLRLEGE